MNKPNNFKSRYVHFMNQELKGLKIMMMTFRIRLMQHLTHFPRMNLRLLLSRLKECINHYYVMKQSIELLAKEMRSKEILKRSRFVFDLTF